MGQDVREKLRFTGQRKAIYDLFGQLAEKDHQGLKEITITYNLLRE